MTLDFDDIRRLLPHEFPFVMIDRVLALTPQVSIEAVKNVSGTEAFVAGHFPRMAIFPGVLIIEAAAQAASVMMLAGRPTDGAIFGLGRVDKFRFVAPVRPGDQLMISIEVVKAVSDGALVTARCTVAGAEVAEGRLSFGRLGTATQPGAEEGSSR